MKRQVWIGGLFLSLCGWASQAGAQEVIWRPVVRPGDAPPPARFRSLPPAGASIGRPTPLAAGPPTAAPPAPTAATPPPAGPSTGVIAASFRAALPKPVPRVLPNDLDGLELSGPAGAAPLPTPGNAAVSPAPVAAAIPPAPLDTAISSAPPPDDSNSAAVHDAEPAILKVSEPIAAEPKPGPAPAEAVAALVAPPPTEAALAAAAQSAPAETSHDPFPEPEPGKPRFYARGEYLLWSVTKDTAPPLVTTSTNPFDFGILGARTTQVLFGGDGLDGGARSGARFTAGLWLDDCDTKGIEVSGFFLGDKSETFNATSAQFPVLGRPFFSLNRNAEFVQLTAFGNNATGSVAVRDSSDLWGLEANARCCLCCGQSCAEDCNPGWHYRVDGLAGFRYLDLSEDLSITENITNFPTPQNRLTNLGLKVFDDFATHNQFYGAQVGLDGTVDLGQWSLNAMGKVALGDTSQEVSIHGSQLRTNLDGTVTPALGGLLALPSNIGTFHKNAFTVVPEADLTVSYHVSDHVRIFAGYDVLFWSSVVRPGQQIDRTLDETQIPNFEPPGTVAPAGQNRPTVLFQRSDLWAQGLNLGLEFRY